MIDRKGLISNPVIGLIIFVFSIIELKKKTEYSVYFVLFILTIATSYDANIMILFYNIWRSSVVVLFEKK